jgi:protein-tyrosine phosphatase
VIFFKKNKPILKDLIPESIADIHSHLLYGLDDGAQFIEESLQLIQNLKQIGFHQCITTTHVMNHLWENSSQAIQAKEAEINALLIDLKEENTLKAAAEYMLDNSFMELLKNEKLLTLKDNFILVELSYSNPPINLFDILYEIQLMGYIPIMAHPERYLYYKKDCSPILKMKNAGCQFQLNLLATVGYYGKEVLQLTDELLEKKVYDFVGTDVHNQNHINHFSDKVAVKNIQILEQCINNNSFFNF